MTASYQKHKVTRCC